MIRIVITTTIVDDDKKYDDDQDQGGIFFVRILIFVFDVLFAVGARTTEKRHGLNGVLGLSESF